MERKKRGREEGKQLKVGHYRAGHGFEETLQRLFNHRRGPWRGIWVVMFSHFRVGIIHLAVGTLRKSESLWSQSSPTWAMELPVTHTGR